MPNDLMNPPAPQATAPMTSPAQAQENLPLAAGEETRGVNIRSVPYAVWQRARQNALASNLPFKAYVIRVLAESGPFPPAAPADPSGLA
ncbi:MAG: hypothetical protein ACYC3I_06570 [Gemmataceae bacterium]